MVVIVCEPNRDGAGDGGGGGGVLNNVGCWFGGSASS